MAMTPAERTLLVDLTLAVIELYQRIFYQPDKVHDKVIQRLKNDIEAIDREEKDSDVGLS